MNQKMTTGSAIWQIAGLAWAVFSTPHVFAQEPPVSVTELAATPKVSEAGPFLLALTANLHEPDIVQSLRLGQWSEDFDLGDAHIYRARLTSDGVDTPFGPLLRLELMDADGKVVATNRWSDGASVTFSDLGIHAHLHIENGFRSTTFRHWREKQRAATATAKADADTRH